MLNPVPKVARQGAGRVEFSGHYEVAVPGGLPLPPRHSVRSLEGASLRPPSPLLPESSRVQRRGWEAGGGGPLPP